MTHDDVRVSSSRSSNRRSKPRIKDVTYAAIGEDESGSSSDSDSDSGSWSSSSSSSRGTEPSAAAKGGGARSSGTQGEGGVAAPVVA